nr:putative membrane protein [Emiliania huxleyi virus 86]
KAQQLENPRFFSGEIMDEVNTAINNGEVVVPNVIGIDAEAKRRRAIADAWKLSDQTTYDMSADFRDL